MTHQRTDISSSRLQSHISQLALTVIYQLSESLVEWMVSCDISSLASGGQYKVHTVRGPGMCREAEDDIGPRELEGNISHGLLELVNGDIINVLEV